MLRSLDDVEFEDIDSFLGQGGYSKVSKVISRKDGNFYALKQVDVLKLQKQECANLRFEIKVHRQLDHPHIIKFVDCLQIQNMVYILLEYASNKSLFPYIHPINGLPEMLALRFFYQTALGVKYLHDHKIVHRDLKPENLLLDDRFNLKICDFGWSCQLGENQVRTTICGTYEYMPPEIVNEKIYTEKVDIWCLGILLYEMIHGKAPFKASNLQSIKLQLNSQKIIIKKEISEKTKDLIYSLLVPHEDRYDINTLLQHPVLTSNKHEFLRPLTKQEYDCLLTNFFFSEYKIKPEDIPHNNVQQPQQQLQNNQLQLNPKLPEINEQMLSINFMVEKFMYNSKRRRNSTSQLYQYQKEPVDIDPIKQFARLNFMKSSILELAIRCRFEIHPSGRIILLEREVDYLQQLYREERITKVPLILFVIFYSSLFKAYKICAVKAQGKKNAVRKLLHRKLRGKSQEELEKITNLPDFVKCQKEGWFALALSLDSAVRVADISLNGQ